MSTFPPILNPRHPVVWPSWMPPIRFRTKPYLELSKSISEALAAMEARHPSPRDVAVLADRADSVDPIEQRRLPRPPK